MSQPKSSLAEKFDIFGFTPVPTGQRISTRKSRWGTYIFITVYLLYMAKMFYGFVYANHPRVNQFTNALDDNHVYKAPRMAFAFLTGDNLNISFYDPKYFTFHFSQVTSYLDPNIPDEDIPIELEPCRPDWLKPVFDAYCPKKDTYLQGMKYGSPINKHPSLEVVLCNNKTSSCQDYDFINWQIMTGRFFVFLEQYTSYDYVSGKPIVDDTPYVSYYYFLITEQFNRAEVKITPEKVTMKPDMFTSFFDKKLDHMAYTDQYIYVSKVPTDKKQSIFLWFCNMSDTVKVTTVVFDTLLDILSKIGAMWTLLFTGFAFYFLRFNKDKYYARKPHMMNFDDRITPLVTATQNLRKTTIETSTEKESPTKSNQIFSTWIEKIVTDSQLEVKLNDEKKPE